MSLYDTAEQHNKSTGRHAATITRLMQSAFQPSAERCFIFVVFHFCALRAL